MAYGHTPFSPTSREFCPSDNAKTTWSLSEGIIKHYAAPTSFKHHPIPDGLIVVSDGVDFRKKIYTTRKFISPKYCRKLRLCKSTIYSVKG